jgi:hypothetical protein
MPPSHGSPHGDARRVPRGGAARRHQDLGCGSTSLIFINEKTQQIGIRLGSLTTSGPLVSQIEQVLGGRFGKLVYPLRSAADSLVYRAWRERKTLETSSLAELVGSASPRW